VLAEVALRLREVLLERNREILRQNLRHWTEFFERHGEQFAWVPPHAGSVAFRRLLEGEVEEFCDALVMKTGVLLAPGTLFEDRNNHFRIGLGRRCVPEALELLESFLQVPKSLPTL